MAWNEPGRKRLIAICTIAIFLSTNLGWAQIPAPVSLSLKGSPQIASISSLIIPEGLGSIQIQHHASSKSPFVIYIQDAHAILDAQNHIQKLISYFQEKYGVRLIALEGGKGKLDPTLFRTFPEELVKKKVLSQYLERGELSGAEMAAVFNSKEADYYGIEDWPLYEKNYLAYLRATESKEKALGRLKELGSQYDSGREKIYSPKLNEFHKHVEAFYEESTHLPELLKFLASLRESIDSASVIARSKATKQSQNREIATAPSGPRNDDLKQKYPHLTALFESLERDSSIDKESLEIQIKKMAESFKKNFFTKLDPKQARDFNANYQTFLTGQSDAGSFLKYLVGLGKSTKARLKLSPTLQELLGRAETLSTIKGTKLFDEIQSFLNETEIKLIAKPEEKALAEKYKKLYLLKDLANLELTRDQWEGYEKNPEESPLLLELLKPALEFYRLVLTRDRAFHKNLANLLKKEKAQSAIVLAGGFHAKGFEESLKEQGYSFAVISPKINSLEGKEVYQNVMQGKLSYKSYLKTTFYDAFVRHASVNLVSGLNEPDFKRDLKLWRDEVIRKLSSEGRISEARQYTRYIDLLFKVYYEKWGGADGRGPSKEVILKAIEKELQSFRNETVSGLWQRFQFQLKEFTQGLRELINQKALTQENISSLLDRVGQTKPFTLKPFGPLYRSLYPDPHVLLAMKGEVSREKLLPQVRSEIRHQSVQRAFAGAATEFILEPQKSFNLPGAVVTTGSIKRSPRAEVRMEGPEEEIIFKVGDPVSPAPISNLLREAIEGKWLLDPDIQGISGNELDISQLNPGTLVLLISRDDPDHWWNYVIEAEEETYKVWLLRDNRGFFRMPKKGAIYLTKGGNGMPYFSYNENRELQDVTIRDTAGTGWAWATKFEKIIVYLPGTLPSDELLMKLKEKINRETGERQEEARKNFMRQYERLIRETFPELVLDNTRKADGREIVSRELTPEFLKEITLHFDPIGKFPDDMEIRFEKLLARMAKHPDFHKDPSDPLIKKAIIDGLQLVTLSNIFERGRKQQVTDLSFQEVANGIRPLVQEFVDQNLKIEGRDLLLAGQSLPLSKLNDPQGIFFQTSYQFVNILRRLKEHFLQEILKNKPELLEGPEIADYFVSPKWFPSHYAMFRLDPFQERLQSAISKKADALKAQGWSVLEILNQMNRVLDRKAPGYVGTYRETIASKNIAKIEEVVSLLIQEIENINRAEVRSKSEDIQKTVDVILKLIDEVANKLNEKKTFVNKRNRKSVQIRKTTIENELRNYSADVALNFLTVLKTYLNDEIPHASLFEGFSPLLLDQLTNLTGKFHLWTVEAIEDFSRNLNKKANEINEKTGKEPVVIEIASGYSDLSFGLKKLLPSMRLIPTDGFYSIVLDEGENLYDAATIKTRGVKKLTTEEIEDGSFRQQLNIPPDAPVILIASHLPLEGDVEKSLLNQSQVNELMIVAAYEPQSNKKGTGNIDVTANDKVWLVDSRPLNSATWFSGLASLEGRVKLRLDTFSRIPNYPKEESGAVSFHQSERQPDPMGFTTSPSGRDFISSIFELPKKTETKTFGELLDSLKPPANYQFPLRKLSKVSSWQKLSKATTISAEVLLDLLTGYLGFALPSLDILDAIYEKTRLNLEQAREFIEILDRHTEAKHPVTKTENQAIKAHFEAKLLEKYPNLNEGRAEVRAKAKKPDMKDMTNYVISLFEADDNQKRLPKTRELTRLFQVRTPNMFELHAALREKIKRKPEALKDRIEWAIRIEENSLTALADYLVDFLEKNPGESLTQIELAKRLGVDPSTVNKNFSFIFERAMAQKNGDASVQARIKKMKNRLPSISRAEVRNKPSLEETAKPRRGMFKKTVLVLGSAILILITATLVYEAIVGDIPHMTRYFETRTAHQLEKRVPKSLDRKGKVRRSVEDWARKQELSFDNRMRQRVAEDFEKRFGVVVLPGRVDIRHSSGRDFAEVSFPIKGKDGQDEVLSLHASTPKDRNAIIYEFSYNGKMKIAFIDVRNPKAVSPTFIPTLVDFLMEQAEKNEEPGVRSGAITGLGNLGKEAQKAIPLLLLISKEKPSPQSFYRHATGPALGQIAGQLPNSEDPRIAEIFQSLRQTLSEDRDPLMQRSAVVGLGEMGPRAKGALPDLRKIKEAADTDRFMREIVETAIQQIESSQTPRSEVRSETQKSKVQVEFKENLEINSLQVRQVWQKVVDDHLRLQSFSEKLEELTRKNGLIFDFPPDELEALWPLVDFGEASRPQSKEELYRMGYVILNGDPAEEHQESFAFNAIFLIAAKRIGLTPNDFFGEALKENSMKVKFLFKLQRALMVILLMSTRSVPEKPEYQSRLDSLSIWIAALSLKGEAQKKESLRQEFIRLVTEVAHQDRIAFWEIAGPSYGGTLPAQLVLLPEFKDRFPNTFLHDPRRFLAELEPVQTEDLFGGVPRKIGEIVDWGLMIPVLPGESIGKVKQFSLPDGSEVYVKRVDPMRVRSPEEEIQIAEKVDRSLQELDPRFHAQKFIGLLYEEGLFYLLSLGVPGEPVHNLPERKSQEVSQIQARLREMGVAQPEGPQRLKDTLKTPDGGYTVLDFESLPYQRSRSEARAIDFEDIKKGDRAITERTAFLTSLVNDETDKNQAIETWLVINNEGNKQYPGSLLAIMRQQLRVLESALKKAQRMGARTGIAARQEVTHYLGSLLAQGAILDEGLNTLLVADIDALRSMSSEYFGEAEKVRDKIKDLNQSIQEKLQAAQATPRAEVRDIPKVLKGLLQPLIQEGILEASDLQGPRVFKEWNEGDYRISLKARGALNAQDPRAPPRLFLGIRVYEDTQPIAALTFYPVQGTYQLESSRRKKKDKEIPIPQSIEALIRHLEDSYSPNKKPFGKFDRRTFEQIESRLASLWIEKLETGPPLLSFTQILHRINQEESVEINPRYLEWFLVNTLSLAQFSYINTPYKLYQAFLSEGFDIKKHYEGLIKKKLPPLLAFTQLLKRMKRQKGIDSKVRALIQEGNVERVLTNLGIGEASYINTSYKLYQALLSEGFDIKKKYERLRKRLPPLLAFIQLLKRMKRQKGIDPNVGALIQERNVQGVLTNLSIGEASYINTSYKLYQAFQDKGFDIKKKYEGLLLKKLPPLLAFIQLLKRMKRQKGIDPKVSALIQEGNVQSVLTNLSIGEASYINISYKLYQALLQEGYDVIQELKDKGMEAVRERLKEKSDISQDRRNLFLRHLRIGKSPRAEVRSPAEGDPGYESWETLNKQAAAFKETIIEPTMDRLTEAARTIWEHWDQTRDHHFYEFYDELVSNFLIPISRDFNDDVNALAFYLNLDSLLIDGLLNVIGMWKGSKISDQEAELALEIYIGQLVDKRSNWEKMQGTALAPRPGRFIGIVPPKDPFSSSETAPPFSDAEKQKFREAVNLMTQSGWLDVHTEMFTDRKFINLRASFIRNSSPLKIASELIRNKASLSQNLHKQDAIHLVVPPIGSKIENPWRTRQSAPTIVLEDLATHLAAAQFRLDVLKKGLAGPEEEKASIESWLREQISFAQTAILALETARDYLKTVFEEAGEPADLFDRLQQEWRNLKDEVSRRSEMRNQSSIGEPIPPQANGRRSVVSPDVWNPSPKDWLKEEGIRNIVEGANKNLDLKRLIENLTKKFSGIRELADLKLAEVIQATRVRLEEFRTVQTLARWVSSDEGKNELQGIALEKVGDLSLADQIVDLIQSVVARGIVLGQALTEENLAQARIALTPLSDPARYLLNHPKVLMEVLKQTHPEVADLDPQKSILVDAALAEVQQKEFKIFVGKANKAGQRISISFNSETPSPGQFARELVRLFLGVTAVSYHSGNPLTVSRVSRAAGGKEVFSFLPQDASVDPALLEQTLFASPRLVRGAVRKLNWNGTLRIAQLILLWSQAGNKGTSMRHILDENALNTAIQFFNSLAQTEIGHQAMARAA